MSETVTVTVKFYSSNKKIKSNGYSTRGASGHPAQPLGDLQQSVCVKEAYGSYCETAEFNVDLRLKIKDLNKHESKMCLFKLML